MSAYREAMAEFAEMSTMDVWYAHLAEADAEAAIKMRALDSDKAKKKAAKEAEKRARRPREKARTRDSLQALSKLAELVDGRYRIVSQPPIVVPAARPGRMHRPVRRGDRACDPRAVPRLPRHVAGRPPSPAGTFEVVDMARKVVGVGSVGTRAFIVLLQGRDHRTRCSCRSRRRRRRCSRTICRRVATSSRASASCKGQRIMQAASDIYLGWTKGVEANRYLYWRQLRDMKGSAVSSR